MSSLPYLSASRLNMLSRCGMQYRYRYEDGIVAPPGIAQIIGTGTHKAIQANLEHKRKHGVLLPSEGVEHEAAVATDSAWDQGDPVLAPEEKAIGVSALRARARDMARFLAGVHHAEAAPHIRPVAVERRFRLAVEGVGVDLVGYIDVEEPDGVRDTKTVGRKPDERAADRSVQLTLYALAVHAGRGGDADESDDGAPVPRRRSRDIMKGAVASGEPAVPSSESKAMGGLDDETLWGAYTPALAPKVAPSGFRAGSLPASLSSPPIAVHLDFLHKGAEAENPYSVQSSTRGPADFAALLQRVEAAVRVIEAGAYYPTDPGNWWCDSRWCGWWQRCPFGARGRRRG